MKITIIIPILNGEKYLENSLNSIINQNYKNWEVIFVNKNSTDNSLRIINKFKNKNGTKIKIINQSKGNLYNAMNLGIKKSEGEIISIMGSDDLFFDSNSFSKIINLFRTNDIEFIYSNIVYIDENNKIIKKVNSKLNNLNYLFFHKVINHQGVFMKKKLFLKNGLFDERYNVAADFDLIIRNLLNSKSFYLNDNISKFRMDGNNISSRLIFEGLDEKQKIIEYYCPNFLLFFAMFYLNLIRLKKYFLMNFKK